jgi:hypothetical protein
MGNQAAGTIPTGSWSSPAPPFKLGTKLPTVTVGVRLHDPARLYLLERSLASIGAQQGVNLRIHIALQGFSEVDESAVSRLAAVFLTRPGQSYLVDNVPNPQRIDLRATLLNRIVDRHYREGACEYLAFLDYDDIWFSHAVGTLIEGLQRGNFAMAYADIHCADVVLAGRHLYVRQVRDVFRISSKTKRNLLSDNFLPLHSYAFQTSRIDQTFLRYDQSLARLEDFDVILAVAREHPVSGLFRSRLIGLYNFYKSVNGPINTTENIFDNPANAAQDSHWEDARKTIMRRHGGASWRDFWGEEWRL